MVGKRGKEAETTREWVALFVFGLSFLGGSSLVVWLEGACVGLSAFGQLLETIDAAGGIDKLLLAGVERMALGADFYAAGCDGRTRVENSTAGAGNSRFLVIGRMDTGFHNGCIADNKTKTPEMSVPLA